MKTFIIKFYEKNDPGQKPGVRIVAQWNVPGDTPTERENEYANQARALIDCIMQALPAGECIATGSADTFEEAEAKTDIELDIRRAADNA